MKPELDFVVLTFLGLLLAPPGAHAHEHLAAGAASPTQGAPLLFTNAGDYAAESGYVFGLDSGDPGGPYEGYYYTGDLVFVALAATPDYGGPQPDAAALGTRIEVVVTSVEGPAGASFSFWETAMDDVDSTNLSWSLPAGLTNGTNHIYVSENNGLPGGDPYGHKHGRIYSVTQPGFYRVGFQFVDTSTNGVNGGPIQAPSPPFFLNLQADLTIASITQDASGVNIEFAAPSNLPDSGEGPATNYTLEATSALEAAAVWQQVGEVVVGDDHLHTVTLPADGTARFFRLRTD